MGLFGLLLHGNYDFLTILVYILSTLAVIFLTLPVHEFAHGFAAVKLGDPTPRYEGRLSLHPFAHIDYLGAACILLLGFGWAKPVQVNSRNFRNPKRDMALTALAGPLANLVMAFFCLLLYHLFILFTYRLTAHVLYYLSIFFWYIANINVYLAVFNLIPIPPLDGSRLLWAVLPYKQYYAIMRYERYIFYGLLVLIWFGVLDRPLAFLSDGLFGALSTVAGLLFGKVG